MAATNFTPIQLYFSTTASAVPLAANLAQGELAINITDGKLYYEDNAGAVQVIATKGAGTIGGTTTQIQYNNAGALAGNAAMVFNNSTNVATLTTLNLTNALGAIYGGTAQSTYTQGDFLYASASNTLAKLGIGTVNYILTSTGTVPQWVAPSSVTVNTATNLDGGAAGSVPYQSGVATTTFLAIGTANRVMTSTGTAPQWVTALTGLTGVSSSSITNTSLTSGRVVVSTTAGLQADDADLTFDGTTLSAGGFSTVGLSTLVKTVKIGDSSFNGVAVFAAATPAKLYMGTGTVTDVTSAISATNTIGAIASLGITPIAATNTGVTYTNAATLYIAGAPSAGTNITITNPYSMYVAAGAAYFGGAVTVAGSLSLAAVTVTSLTDSGNLTFTGTGNRITGDFSNATVASRVMFQTSTVNSTTNLGLVPNGTGTASVIDIHNASDPTNAAKARMAIDGTAAFFVSGINGTGTYLPMAFYAGGSEAMRIAVDAGGIRAVGIGYTTLTGVGNNGLAVLGNVGIGTSSPSTKLHVAGTSAIARIDRTADASANPELQLTAVARQFNVGVGGASFATAAIQGSYYLYDATAADYRFVIDSAGLVGIGTSDPTSKLHVVGGRTDLTAASETYALGVRYGTGTGIYYIGASNSATPDLVFSQTGGSERMRLTNAGDLGIGNSSPTAKLDVTGGINLSGQLLAGTSGSVYSPIVSAAYVSGTSNLYMRNLSGVNRLDSYNDPITATYPFQLNASTMAFQIADSTKMTLASSGNVGIGTTSPGYLLNTYASTTSLSIQQVVQNNNAGAGTAALGFSVSFVAGEGLNTKGGIGFQRNAAYGGGFMAFYNNNSGAAGDFTTADEKMRIDSSGNVLVTSAAGLGYGTGAGGTVTQATSKATGVTLNKPTGQITMNNAALAGNTTVSFALSNTLLAEKDNLILNITNASAGGGTGGGNYNIWATPYAGGTNIWLKNISAGSLSEALVINFSIIKGASS